MTPSGTGESQESVDRISPGIVVAYGLGDVGSNLVWGMGTAFLLIFYTDVFGLAAASVATLFLVARGWDAVNDPIMGLITERVRTRWGKFRPYLLFGAPVLGVLLVLTFSTPDLGDRAKLVYAYVTYISLGMVYTATNLPFGAMAVTMTQSPGGRNALSAARSLGALIGGGLIVGLATPSLVRFFGGGDATRGYQLTATLYAVLCVAALWTTFFSCKERHVAARPQAVGPWALLRVLGSNRPFLMITIGILVLASGAFIRTSTVPFYMTYYVGRPALLGPLLGTIAIGTIVGILAGARIVAARVGKRNTLATGLVVSTSCYLGLFFTPASAILVQFLLFGFGAVGSGFGLSIIWSMISDTVEYGEWQTGKRIEGGTYSVASFVAKLASAIAGAVPAMILYMTGYVPNVEQTELAREGILWMVSLVPFTFSALGLIPVYLYRLDEATFSRIVAEIANRQRDAPRSE